MAVTSVARPTRSGIAPYHASSATSYLREIARTHEANVDDAMEANVRWTTTRPWRQPQPRRRVLHPWEQVFVAFLLGVIVHWLFVIVPQAPGGLP